MSDPQENPEGALATSSVWHRSFAIKPHYAKRAVGSTITLEDGRQILDACGGAAVSCIGQANEEVVAAAAEQLRKAGYVHSMTYTTDAAEELAASVLKDNPFGLEKAFFVCSGSEAMDTALKLARQYFFEKGEQGRVNFISRKQSYHGNTIGAMAVSSNLARKIPYEPFQLPNVHYVTPANAYRYMPPGITNEKEFSTYLADELDSRIQSLGPSTVIAFIAEPVVGATTGCMPPPDGYFERIRKVCDKYGILLILDEVMCGMGRTGTYFAFEQDGIVPDIVTLGKGLGGGYAPIAAVLAHKKVVDAIREGSSSFVHGHTYQAHPLSCAMSLAVQGIIRREGLIRKCADMGTLLERKLRDAFRDAEHVGNIRGRGLFWGVEFVEDRKTKKPFPKDFEFGPRVQKETFDKGVAIYPGTGTADGVEGDHVLFAPAYNVTEQEIDQMVTAAKAAYDRVLEDL